MFSRNTDWHAFVAHDVKTLITGERERGLLMRRKLDGAWEFRRPTPREEEDFVSSDAW
jgi:hypothetical protein